MASDLEHVKAVIGQLRECGVTEKALEPLIKWWTKQIAITEEV